jgi:hypothetical protein
MVHLPFREKKSDKSELVKMALAERARQSKEKPSESQEKVMSSKEKLTSKELPSVPKLILPKLDTDSGSTIARETRVEVRLPTNVLAKYHSR